MSGIVGQFPGLADARRRVIRSPTNPLDVSTIVSIFCKEIYEVKHTIQPGRFLIPAGSYENPAILVVGPSSWWREIDEDQPMLEIPTSSIQIADSVVRDYANGLLGYNGQAAMPGLFYVPGRFSVFDIKKNYKHELDAALVRQKAWYQALVRLADALWARSNGNPLAISDDMRMAARELGQPTKDWMKDFTMVDMVRCVACGSLRNPVYPVCPTCKNVDTSNPAAKDMKFLAQDLRNVNSRPSSQHGFKQSCDIDE